MNMVTDRAEAFKNGTEAAKNLLEIAKELKGSFAYFKAMPSVALVKMNNVLKEIDDTVHAVGEVIDKYLEIGLDLKSIDEGPKVLIDLSGSGLKQLIEDKRGHCSTISGIRYHYLDGWFDKYRNDYQEQSKIVDNIFNKLSDADNSLFNNLADVAKYIQLTGEQALKYAFGGNLQDAKDLVAKAAVELLELRSSIEDIHAELSSIKSQYIKQMRLSTATG